MKIGLRFLLAAICTACMTSTAIASNIVLGYNDNSLSCGFQAAACQGLPGVVGSNLVGAGGAAAPGLFQGFSFGTGSSLTFSMSGYTGHVDSLTFNEFNNDCQNSGTPSGCTNTNGSLWQVAESLNGGASSTILNFGSGLSNFALLPFTASVNLDLVATDTLAFTFMVTGLDPNRVGTSAIAFQDIDVNGPSTSSVPEPGSLPLLGLGAIGLVGFLRRKRAS